jgi:hypothetical protein
MRAGLRFAVLAILAAVVVAAGAGVVRASTYIPGVTDFPNALRLEQQHEPFIAGKTDFPNALRVETRSSSSGAVAKSDSGIDWSDTGIWLSASLAAIGLAGSVTIMRRMRHIRAN